MAYKLMTSNGVYSIIKDNSLTIPKDSGNRHYQEFLQDVKNNGMSIVTGADVVTPDYKYQRLNESDGYKSFGEQLDMQYKNNGSWESHIAAVKSKYPKTNTGSTTVAEIPSWVQEEVDKL